MFSTAGERAGDRRDTSWCPGTKETTVELLPLPVIQLCKRQQCRLLRDVILHLREITRFRKKNIFVFFISNLLKWTEINVFWKCNDVAVYYLLSFCLILFFISYESIRTRVFIFLCSCILKCILFYEIFFDIKKRKSYRQSAQFYISNTSQKG